MLESLKDFDGIVSLDLLKQVNAQIDITNNKIEYDQGMEKIKFTNYQQVNHFQIHDADVPAAIRSTFNRMIDRMINTFADVNESFRYNINTVATIATGGEPVCSELYP